MGGGHHVDWSDSQQSKSMADYQESIQRPNLYKPSVSGQRQPSHTSAACQWSRNNATKAPYAPNWWSNLFICVSIRWRRKQKRYSGTQVQQGSRHRRHTGGATKEPRTESSQYSANASRRIRSQSFGDNRRLSPYWSQGKILRFL